MNRKLQRNARGLGLAAMIGAAGMLMLTFATPADAGPRDRRDAYVGHAERGHDGPRDRRGDIDRDRRFDRREADRRMDRRERRERRERLERRHRFHRHDRFSRHERFDRRHARRFHFDVPQRLHHGHLADYRPYRRGRVYYRQHGHFHQVYDFPVLTRFGWKARPHFYCEGSLYGGGYIAYRGHNIDIGLRF